MAEVDTAKRWKAFRGDTGWNDVTPHGTLSCGSGDVENAWVETDLSPRQSFAQPSLAPTKDVNMFKVTEDWITRHPTKMGGYKAAQLRLIGVKWPPKQGWKKRAAGRLISMEDKERFESYGSPVVPKTVSSVVLSCGCDVLPWEDCEHTEREAHNAMLEILSLK